MKAWKRQPLLGMLLALQLRASSVSGAAEKKIQPDELIARHLASIGTAEALAAARSRACTGTASFYFRLGGHGELQGTAGIFSEKEQLFIGMLFNSMQYPGERFAYNGSNVAIGHVKPGVRSALARFIFAHDLLLREGLLGGSTTTAWALFHIAERKPNLKYTGLRKVEGKQQHELSYRARRGAGDLQVWLYFDPSTYRHTSSVYKLVRTANMATEITESPYQRDSLYKLLEQFEDFRQVDGLMLPHTYKIEFSMDGEPTILQDWVISINEARHNVALQPDTFFAR